ncbi:RidA family protein [Salmonella enterica subsp. enterica serovar Richmond]|nr:RidA family protein [Salmonella enterica subsp. enterica serovar Richmond]ECG3313336.1 RidA family protein [Salmonella enterica subsp. enterica serovar Richmond]
MIINSPDAPAAVGPYVQAVKANGFIFVSGCIPLEPETNMLCPGGIKEQTRRVMMNLQAVLNASGLTFSHIVKTTCFIRNMNEFLEFNEVYESFFNGQFLARSCIEVCRLPRDALVEIEAIVSQ